MFLNLDGLLFIRKFNSNCSDCNTFSEHGVFVDSENNSYEVCSSCKAYHVYDVDED